MTSLGPQNTQEGQVALPLLHVAVDDRIDQQADDPHHQEAIYGTDGAQYRKGYVAPVQRLRLVQREDVGFDLAPQRVVYPLGDAPHAKDRGLGVQGAVDGLVQYDHQPLGLAWQV